MTALASLGRFSLFVGAVVSSSLRHPPPVRDSLREAYSVGVTALPILLVISFFMGTNLSVQGYNAFVPLGGQRMVGLFVALAGVRELAPIMVASLVAAKSGTEMASQIAVMRIQSQIDALEVMAVDPRWYLVTPRLIGILAVLPALTMISIFTMVGAAWGAAVFQLGLNGHEFLQLATETTRVADLVYCSIKALVFGVVICLVSCYFGFHASGGATGVGRATNASVVTSAVVCVVLNYLLSELLFG